MIDHQLNNLIKICKVQHKLLPNQGYTDQGKLKSLMKNCNALFKLVYSLDKIKVSTTCTNLQLKNV
jgi:hypothetical protein